MSEFKRESEGDLQELARDVDPIPGRYPFLESIRDYLRGDLYEKVYDSYFEYGIIDLNVELENLNDDVGTSLIDIAEHILYEQDGYITDRILLILMSNYISAAKSGLYEDLDWKDMNLFELQISRECIMINRERCIKPFEKRLHKEALFLIEELIGQRKSYDNAWKLIKR